MMWTNISWLLLFVVTRCCVLCLEAELDESATVLNFSSLGLTELRQDFAAYENLEEINLSHNEIERVYPKAFERNMKLKRIDLSSNPLHLSDFDVLLYSPSLESINLSNCHIERLPGNMLDGLPHLVELDLSSNPINFEESLLFKAKLPHPPLHLIIQEINDDDLAFVCASSDNMTITVINRRVKFVCKNLNTQTAGDFEPEEQEEEVESTWNDIERQQFIPVQTTHEEEMMLGDQGVSEDEQENEGSGLEVESAAIITTSDDIQEQTTTEIVITTTEATTESFIGRMQQPKKPLLMEEFENQDIENEKFDPPSQSPPKDEQKDVEVLNKSDYKVQPDSDGNDKATQASSSQNIILIVIVGIVAVGAGLGGYRYYEHKKNEPVYDAVVTRNNATEGCELKEIAIGVEEKPLMNNGEAAPDGDKVTARDALENRTNAIPSIDVADDD